MKRLLIISLLIFPFILKGQYVKDLSQGSSTNTSAVANLVKDTMDARFNNSETGIALKDTTSKVRGSYVTPTQFAVVQTTLNNILAALPGYDFVSPNLDSAVVGRMLSTKLVMYFNENLKHDSIPPTGSFTVKVNSSPVTKTSSMVNKDSCVLTLTNPVVNGNNVTVAYTKGWPALQDSSHNRVAGWSDHAVTNRVKAVANNIITNGVIGDGTSWGKGGWDGSTATFTDGAFQVIYPGTDATARLWQHSTDMASPMAINSSYTLSFDLTITSGTIYMVFLSVDGGVTYKNEQTYTTAGTKTITFSTSSSVSDGGIKFACQSVNSNTITIDNIVLIKN
jgi:uncharacterized repeat protein (TIGR02059 family)